MKLKRKDIGLQLILILGNQLFDPRFLLKHRQNSPKTVVFMREDYQLCTRFCYHKHKLIFFLSAMRHYAEELKQLGFSVHYQFLSKDAGNFVDSFKAFILKHSIDSVAFFEIEDKFFARSIHHCLQGLNISVKVWSSPMFLTTRQQFSHYLKQHKRPFMKTFYQQQRQRLQILVDANREPVGGCWSFDEQNRKKLPIQQKPPDLPLKPQSQAKDLQSLIELEFAHHPGDTRFFGLPTQRQQAKAWLDVFLQQRLYHFGAYEDALPQHSSFVYHSLLSPFLNTGLLTPRQVIYQTLRYAQHQQVPLNSLEGFIRQIIGWREFIRGIYQNFSHQQETGNFWHHQRQLSQHWYRGNTGIPPLDDVIEKVLRYGYAHHIERLMVIGSLMLLLEVQPQAAHRWFMEMFVDSADWVMGPNVYGMALFSDGGIFATKPYICGSNYYKKMGSYQQGDWQQGVDGLYWSFIAQHQDFFAKQFRSSMMLNTLAKMPAERKQRLFNQAQQLKAKLTVGT